MENHFKGCGIILGLGFLCFALGSSAIEVVTANEFNTTKGTSVRIWNTNIPIYSNGLMFVRVGTRNLEINCSISSNSEKLINIGWRKGQNWLDSRSVELLRSNDANVLRLKIDLVSWDLNGSIFWCGPQDGKLFYKNVKGSQVTIITGDLPKPPIYIRHNIVDLRLYIINIYWRAPPNAGRLPAHYNVTYIPCINKTYCQESSRLQFCNVNHIIGKVNYKCSKPREEMKALPESGMRDLYRVTLAMVNPLGESKGPEFEVDVDFGGPQRPLLPTPRPPLSLNLSATKSNTINIRWTPRSFWTLYDNEIYTILYHKDNDHTNKTVKVQGQKGQTVLTLRKADGIEPFTRYYIYITVEFIEGPSNESSGVSEALGPKIIRTLEGTPDPGPGIFNTSSIRYPNDSGRRNVTVTWKEPPPSMWRGKPSHIKVIYRLNRNDQDFQEEVIPAIPNPPSQAILTGLDSTAAYTVSVTLCNSRRCGGKGKTATIQAITGPNEVGKTDFTTYIWVIVLIFVTIVPSAALLVYCIKTKRKSRNKGNQRPLNEMIGDLEPDIRYTNRYQDVDQQSYISEYDVPLRIASVEV